MLRLALDEALPAMASLKDSGACRAIGIGVNEQAVCLEVMPRFDLDCILLAGRYTLLEQDASAAVLAEAARRGVGIVVGGPFNSGVLVGNRKFNYADAPAGIIARVEQLEAVCREFGVPLPAAALQFPMAHPAVVSCIPGGRDVEQLRKNAAWFELPIPGALWSALKERGLLDRDAPVPAGRA